MFSFQVPQQLPGSNNCEFHIFMFADHFLKVHTWGKITLYHNQKQQALGFHVSIVSLDFH